MSDVDQYCSGCAPMPAGEDCQNSFARIGVIKVHWECWSACNLPCAFCYRVLGAPLITDDAKKLISAVVASGARTIVFAGGDPSIRPDISELISYSRAKGLGVEVQTNAHCSSPNFLKSLNDVQLVGLSLDGPNSEVHDQFRGTRGNFDQVLQMLGLLAERHIPVIVRSVVTKTNYEHVAKIGELLSHFPNVARWSLLEFSAVGRGFVNRGTYELPKDLFESVAAEAKNRFHSAAQLDIYRERDKMGTYVLVTPEGLVYGTTPSPKNGIFPTVGSILSDHLSTIAASLPFSRDNHLKRYDTV